MKMLVVNCHILLGAASANICCILMVEATVFACFTHSMINIFLALFLLYHFQILCFHLLLLIFVRIFYCGLM